MPVFDDDDEEDDDEDDCSFLHSIEYSEEYSTLIVMEMEIDEDAEKEHDFMYCSEVEDTVDSVDMLAETVTDELELLEDDDDCEAWKDAEAELDADCIA
jgi:hypothetical protein